MPAATPCPYDGDAAQRDLLWLRHFVCESRQALCRRIASRIPSEIRRFLDADDVLQEAYIDLFRHSDSIASTADAEALRRWVGRIALHRLADALRIARAVKRGGGAGHAISLSATQDPGSGDGCGDPPPVEPDLHERVDRILALLPPSQKTAMRLVYLEGRSLEEAAKVMGRTPSAVRTLCYKGRKRLRIASASAGDAPGGR